jgi:hypothetical protein
MDIHIAESIRQRILNESPHGAVITDPIDGLLYIFYDHMDIQNTGTSVKIRFFDEHDNLLFTERKKIKPGDTYVLTTPGRIGVVENWN